MITALGWARTMVKTTLDIDDDVLAAAKNLAQREGKTAGKLVSELMREALRIRMAETVADRPSRESLEFKPISAGGAIVTNEMIENLRDELGV